METSQFGNTKTGKLVPTIENMMGFVPSKLPPELDLTQIIEEFGKASAALGGLNSIGSTINKGRIPLTQVS